MEQSIGLGRVAGIRVGVNWSVLVIAVLLGWGLADLTLPDAAPGYATGLYWLSGLVAVVVFFAGLLAHELAHSLVARNEGVDVEDITLWLFGGVSRLRGEATSPRAELRIAVAGPITSVGVAGAFAVLAGAVASLNGPSLAIAVCAWLAGINAVLAVFNLVPAAPLDGGRVLHAVVWRRTGDRAEATATATRAGQRFAYVLMGIGVLLFLVGDLAAVWFIFLGWFLLSAARAEATQDLLRGALADVQVRDVMTPDPIVVPDDLPVDRLVDEWFLRKHCSAFPVVDASGRVNGLVTLQRVRGIHPAQRATLRAYDVAESVETIARGAPDDALAALLEAIAGAGGGGGRALVFDGDDLVGIVSPTDVRRALDVAALRHPHPAVGNSRRTQSIGNQMGAEHAGSGG